MLKPLVLPPKHGSYRIDNLFDNGKSPESDALFNKPLVSSADPFCIQFITAS